MTAQFASVACYLPDRIVTSDEVENLLRATNPSVRIMPGIIAATTGIVSRRFAADDEFNSHMAAKAARRVLDKASVASEEVDLLIFASAGQDLLEPATGHIVQDMLGTSAVVFDVKNACNSFLNALEVAEAFIAARRFQRILVVAGETPSRSIKWRVGDREDLKRSFAGYTLGDAGAAALVVPSEEAGIIAYKGMADSSQWGVGTLPGGGSRHPRGDEYSYFQGDGVALKDAFERQGPAFLLRFLQEQGITPDQLDRVFMHQVTVPYLESLMDSLDLDHDKLEQTIDTFGNVAAATIPLGICRSIESESLKRGDLIMLVGLAGGISLEVVLMRW